MSKYSYKETPYGFRWGPMWVERAASDEKGGVVLRVATAPAGEGAGRVIYIRVSPRGQSVTVEPGESVRVAFAKGGGR
jgi:hypothetical protein